jgi:hypothetical protein
MVAGKHGRLGVAGHQHGTCPGAMADSRFKSSGPLMPGIMASLTITSMAAPTRPAICDRLGSVRGLEHDVAVGSQAKHGQAAHVGLVLYDQHGLDRRSGSALTPAWARTGVGGAGFRGR